MISKGTLIIIPARKGSKGLPGKNTKQLGDRSLIAYSIEFAKEICKPDDVVCISSNDPDVNEIAELYGVKPPFIRPDEISDDHASTFDVIKHAIDQYGLLGRRFEKILLLQPTSPFRLLVDFEQMQAVFNSGDVDMVVSVKVSKESPYFTIFLETEKGFLERFTKNPVYDRRQNAPPVFTYNGSLYLVRTSAFEEKGNFSFDRIKKYIMPDERSVDIDTLADWALAEYYLKINNEDSSNHSKA